MSIGFVAKPPFGVLKDIVDKSRDMEEIIKRINNFENILDETMYKKTIEKIGVNKEDMRPLFSQDTVKQMQNSGVVRQRYEDGEER